MVSSHPLHFLFDLVLARTRSKVELNQFIINWNEHFVVSKEKIYVRTTNSSNQTVVLSEAQSYGMLITCCSCRKG